MKIILSTIGIIFIASCSSFYNFEHSCLGLLCVLIGIVFLCSFIFFTIKERKEEKENSFIKVKSYITDGNAELVINSIGNAENGFIVFNEIVSDTNLPLKKINKALEWLVVNKLATECKGRMGKVYELTPEGRNSFKSILHPTSNG